MSANSFQRTSQQFLDISPLDFYLLGNLKTVVYSAQSENEETIHQCNFYPCQTLRNLSGTSEWVRESMVRRVHACIDSGGGCFEHL